jgi:hypothetical protein
MSRPLALTLAVATTALAWSPAASAYCPCYSPNSGANTHDCGVAAANGKNPTTAQWNDIFDLVSQGPSMWGDSGPSVTDIGQGCGKPEASHNVAARFPCELLKGIAMQESGWRQFCVPDAPSDQVGGASRTIISFDCGYGIGQVTSGMHKGDNPGFDRNRVASDPTYNLATGTQILAAKWKATNCVGDNQPTITSTTPATPTTTPTAACGTRPTAERPRTRKKSSAGWSTPRAPGPTPSSLIPTRATAAAAALPAICRSPSALPRPTAAPSALST